MSEAHCNNLAQRKVLGLVTHDNTGGPFVVECQGCGEVYPSFHCLGGEQIADTGDHEDARCPHCDHVDPEECDNAALAWNTQQLKINELQLRLNALDERMDALASLVPEAALALKALNVAVSVYDVELADSARRGLRVIIAALNPTANPGAVRLRSDGTLSNDIPTGQSGHISIGRLEQEPDPIKGMIEARGGKFAIMIDENNGHYGWTFMKDANGMWVSGRRATDGEMHAARTHAHIKNQL